MQVLQIKVILNFGEIKKSSSCHSNKIDYLIFLMTTSVMILRFYNENFHVKKFTWDTQTGFSKTAKLKLYLTQFKVGGDITSKFFKRLHIFKIVAKEVHFNIVHY